MLKVVRPLSVTFFLIITAMSSTPADAREIGRYTEAEVKAFCQNIRNAAYLESMGVYGCRWIRDVGSYGVLCDKNGCFYSTPARRQVRGSGSALRDIARNRR